MAASSDGREREGENHYRCATMFHPLRQRIASSLSGDVELVPAELAAKLEQPLGRIGYHLRILLGRRVLKVVPRRRSAPPRYRWSDDAEWAREMLIEEDE
jgi:DNA-binding transcriptional ArsR family regulator